MEYDQDKVDEMTLALIYLVATGKQGGGDARAWKGFDWNTLLRLYRKGWLKEPKIREMSIYLTEEGFRKAQELFQKNFGKDNEKSRNH